MELGKEHYAQFVTFNTAGALPLELFQQSWIPLARSFLVRGIENIILSEKLVVPGELNPFKFVSKHWWHSRKALENVFTKGLPVPATKGHITVSQAGVFKAVSWTDDITKHRTMIPKTENFFKALFMLPTLATPLDDSAIDEIKNFLTCINGFISLCVYKLDEVSGDYSNVWLFQWVIEVYFDMEDVDPIRMMEGIRNDEHFTKEWKISILKDSMQLSPKE